MRLLPVPSAKAGDPVPTVATEKQALVAVRNEHHEEDTTSVTARDITESSSGEVELYLEDNLATTTTKPHKKGPVTAKTPTSKSTYKKDRKKKKKSSSSQKVHVQAFTCSGKESNRGALMLTRNNVKTVLEKSDSKEKPSHKNGKTSSTQGSESTSKTSNKKNKMSTSSCLEVELPLPAGKLGVRFEDANNEDDRLFAVVVAKIRTNSPLVGKLPTGAAIKGCKLGDQQNGEETFYPATNMMDFSELLWKHQNHPGGRVLVFLPLATERRIQDCLVQNFPPTKIVTVVNFHVADMDPETGHIRSKAFHDASFDEQVLDLKWKKIPVQEIVAIQRAAMQQQYATVETTTSGRVLFNTKTEEEMKFVVENVTRCISRAKAKASVTKSLLNGKSFRLETCPHCLNHVVLTCFKKTPQAYCAYCDSLFHPGNVQQVESKDMKTCDECGLFCRPAAWKSVLLCRSCLLPKAKSNCLQTSEQRANYHYIKHLAQDKELPPQYSALNVANDYARNGRVQESLRLYQQMLQQSPASRAALHYNMAVIRKQNGDLAGAHKNCQAALTNCSNFAPATHLAVDVYAETIRRDLKNIVQNTQFS